MSVNKFGPAFTLNSVRWFIATGKTLGTTYSAFFHCRR
jgi:hypothetical protein